MNPGEMTTAGTDALLALTAFVLAVRLHRTHPGRSAKTFVVGLAAAGVAAGGGALFHGLRSSAPKVLLGSLWALVPLGVAVTNLATVLGVVRAHGGGAWSQRVVGLLLWVKLVVVVGHGVIVGGLASVGVDLFLTVALLLAVEGAAWLRGRAGSAFFVAGALTTLAGLVVQLSAVRHGAPWNHNDFFHLMQLGAMCLFYAGARGIEGARALGDAPGAPRVGPLRLVAAPILPGEA